MTVDNDSTAVHRPVRSRDEILDAAEIREFLDSAYGVRLRLRQMRNNRPSLRHARVDIGPVTVDDVQLPGGIEASPDPLNKVVAVWTDRGRVSGQCGDLVSGAGPEEVTLLSQPDLPYRVESDDAHSTTVLLDPGLLAAEAGKPTDGADAPLIRFSSFRPVDEAAARLWRDTVRYVKHSVLSQDDVATPLVLGHCSRLLAAVTLATFPNTIVPEQAPHDHTDSGPALLRRATAYIEANAGNDIALTDIAEAVHVTPRAVQYMFRRHLDMTPLQYLRRIRLDLAHRDLQIAEHPDQTVTQIAARWGFMHTGRFAVLYRQTFGRSPHETLRG
jgi:AraC-like DNA-binding protein